MDEKEWLENAAPLALVTHFRGLIDDRQQRLFACACVRSVWHNIQDERFRAIVELSETYADNGIAIEHLEHATRMLFAVTQGLEFSAVLSKPSISAMVAARSVGDRNVSLCIDQAIKYAELSAAPHVPLEGDEGRARPDHRGMKEYGRLLADLLRDIVGNPFQSLSLHPDWLAWNDGTVGQLAETIYLERRYQDLPVLADALEEAGCDEPEILDHLRRPGVHARGCWVLDLARGVREAR